MERCWIRGTSGSGKTTLGLLAGERLGIPAIDLDELYWLPGWQTRSKEEFAALVKEATARPCWILSGNYQSIREAVEASADTIIWLDYPFPLVLGRMLRRTFRRVFRGELCCNGNREEVIKSFFTRESVIWWCITTHRRRHRQCLEFLAGPTQEGQTRLRHRHPRETAAWLESLSRGDGL